MLRRQVSFPVPFDLEFYDDGRYNLGFKSNSSESLTGMDLIEFYLSLLEKYPIVSIEDPFDQDDWHSWAGFTSRAKCQVVGDDLTVTNVSRIKQALDSLACNSLLVKVNQIGTLTEAIDACKLVASHGWRTMISHRSGETEDNFIADLAVAIGCGQIKAGAPCRSERLSKYNRLLR
jgi:enolase